MLPVSCHYHKKKKVYLTGKRIAALFREAVKALHLRMSKADLSRYSADSLRVWACVLQDEAGMSPEFIMSRLRWTGNSFRMYLCNTGIIQDKHRDIPWAAYQEVIDLIAGRMTNTHNIARMSMVERDTTMGNFINDME